MQSRPHSQHSGVLHWLAHLGMPGLFLLSVLDSFVIPLPIPGSTDLLLLWLVSHHGNPWVLTAWAVSGSLLGGYLTWKVGKKGGEASLHRYAPRRVLEAVERWAESHPMLALFVPTLLPPPVPLTPFLLAAGALKVSLRRFMLVYGAARVLRYGLVAWLAVHYGRHVIRLWSATLDKWSAPLGWTFGTVMAAGILYGIWKFRRQRAASEEEPALEPSASRGD